ncbi:hypothetical protein AKJ40_04095 [candidate division MSBL1 archaeon SCGC-AAA259M10]|uniref:Hydroxymethylbilane synthase n=1 Tax=candidate division MSBL1 archaeon SCGC-AAA259M10 TaxID=1698270 RepID=A0A133UXX7_9EURY|nr:hypothetical protein AKJ40_04095 [candidate division MSBL1 archaeon SCGC-AAA259M10]
MKIKVGTRGSDLALIQTRSVVKDLESCHPSAEVEIEIIKTSGDLKSKPFGDGVFVKEIDMVVLDRKIDMGVHSLKDEPTDLPEGLSLACVPERLNPCDILITRGGNGLRELAEGSLVGTGSPRRRREIQHLRSNLNFKNIRGNIPTRIKKVEKGKYDALVTSYAAVDRMDLEEKVSQEFDPKEVVPAAGQGALGVVCRSGEEKKLKLDRLNDERGYRQTSCERSFLRELGLGCRSGVGAIAETEGEYVRLFGVLNEGKERLIVQMEGEDPIELGKRAGEVIKNDR